MINLKDFNNEEADESIEKGMKLLLVSALTCHNVDSPTDKYIEAIIDLYHTVYPGFKTTIKLDGKELFKEMKQHANRR